jgi:hypothetical protein
VVFAPTGGGSLSGSLVVNTASGGPYSVDLIGGGAKAYLPLVVAAP